MHAVILAVIASAASCTITGISAETEILLCPESIYTRSSDPQEDMVNDMNIFVFDDRGTLISRIYLEAGEMGHTEKGYSVRMELPVNSSYSIYALANAGYSIAGGTSVTDLKESRYYFTYPDEYRGGIPMSGIMENILVSSDETIRIPLKRTMAKISVSIDRSRLDEDVEFTVKSLEIGGCPKYVTPFASSSISSEYDAFISGFSKRDDDVAILNTDSGWGKSGEVSLYMFENMQGDLIEGITDYRDKILDDSDPKARVCSYIEMEMDYISSTHFSTPGKSLIYRFYLGESPGNFDIIRNTHYHITVIPENDGLAESGWRIDKSNIEMSVSPFMKIYPGTFIRGKVGETHHIRCEYYPEDAPFDIGIEELEYDRERGIYDYTIDPDGKGVTLHLKGRGTGLLYFEAGYPVNDAEIISVVVD